MEHQPILIHSLFRTGSTYIWNRLRHLPGLCCYYEPFHPELARITVDSFSPWLYDTASTNWIHHPPLDKPHFMEYRKILRKGLRGVPGFKHTFSLKDYCRHDDHPLQKQYLDTLITAAKPEKAVMQFNRSSLRTKWFRRVFPGAMQMYLVRNPENQFQSQLSLNANLGVDTFLVMDLMTAALNRHTPEFIPLARIFPLPLFNHADFSAQRRFFSRVYSAFSLEERYAVFYYLWFSALAENLAYPDDILSIDALSLDPAYRKTWEEKFSGLCGETVDFSDAAVRQYPSSPIDEDIARLIRRAMQARILAREEIGDLTVRLQQLPARILEHLKLDADLPDPLPTENRAAVPGIRPIWEIRDAIMEILGADLERRYEERRLLRSTRTPATTHTGDLPADKSVKSSEAKQLIRSLESRARHASSLKTELLDMEQSSLEQSSAWAKKVVDLETQLSRLTIQLRDNREELRQALKKGNEMSGRIRTFEDSVSGLTRQLQRREQELSRIHNDLETARNRAAESAARENLIAGESTNLRRELDSLRNTLWFRLGKRVRLFRDSK